MNSRFIPLLERSSSRLAALSRWAVDSVLITIVFFIPNLILAMYFSAPLAQEAPGNLVPPRLAGYANMPLYGYTLWAAVNLVLLLLLLVVRRLIVLPLNRITQHLHQLHGAYSQETGRTEVASPLNIGRLAMEVGRFAAFALEHYRKHQELSIELAQAREIIAQFTSTQQTILKSTNREIALQYRSVLSYANYLEGQIMNNKLDPILRYDLDDVCESSFNLKLIAGALTMLSTSLPAALDNVPLAPLMQQTMLALAPSLDRRSMKLTSAEVDMSVAARGDPEILAQILWMMLLGMIRYAADESTLRIRCLHSRDGTQAIMSIVVSELSPVHLSEDERSDYLVRHLQHLTPHMFAETIRIHGNIQLANLLLNRIEGTISVLPLTVSSCEVCLVLPAAQIDQTVK